MLKKHHEKTDLSQISSKYQWSKWPGPFRQTLSHLSAKNAAAVTLKCYNHTSSQIPVLSMCSFPVSTSIRFYQCLRTNVTSTKQCASLGLWKSSVLPNIFGSSLNLNNRSICQKHIFSCIKTLPDCASWIWHGSRTNNPYDHKPCRARLSCAHCNSGSLGSSK